jgi:hypothetical protein
MSNDRTERQPPTGTVERTRRVRMAARPRTESGAAVRSSDLVRRSKCPSSQNSPACSLRPVARAGLPATSPTPTLSVLRALGVKAQPRRGHPRQIRYARQPQTPHPRLTRTNPPNVPAHRRRGNGVRLSTETGSRRSVQPACCAVFVCSLFFASVCRIQTR